MADRPRLCYLLLNYERRTDRHYYHLYEFLEELARYVDIYLISLGGERPDLPGIAHAEVLSGSVGDHGATKPPGTVSTLAALLRARLRGYRTFFVHYSFAAARRAALVGRLTGARVFLWHSILVDRLLDDVDAPKIARRSYEVTFRLVDRLVTSSAYMKDYYQRAFGLPQEKVKVVRNSISLGRFDPTRYDREAERERLGYGEDDLVVLYVHGLERGKGCLEIPEIASFVKVRVPAARFEVVGDGSRRQEIAEELERRRVDDCVTMRGSVPNQEIPRFYAAADLFIMPSRFEEFTRTLLEAMAMGVPFVATDGTGPTFAYVSQKQRTFVVPAGRTLEFATRTARLLGDDAARRDLALDGMEFVRRYSLERARDEFMMEILGANPPMPE